jgi:hypothetical protein
MTLPPSWLRVLLIEGFDECQGFFLERDAAVLNVKLMAQTSKFFFQLFNALCSAVLEAAGPG